MTVAVECATCRDVGQLSEWVGAEEVRYVPCADCAAGMRAMGIGPLYAAASLGDFAELDIKAWNFDVPGWLVTGPVGSGKTHLAVALCREAARRGLVARFIESPRLLDYCRSTFDNDQEVANEAREKLEAIARAEVLVIDDLGSERPTDFAKERLFLWIDDLYKQGRPVVLTSNLSLPDIEAQLGSRIGSRLSAMVRRMVLQGRDRRR